VTVSLRFQEPEERYHREPDCPRRLVHPPGDGVVLPSRPGL